MYERPNRELTGATFSWLFWAIAIVVVLSLVLGVVGWGLGWLGVPGQVVSLLQPAIQSGFNDKANSWPISRFIPRFKPNTMRACAMHSKRVWFDLVTYRRRRRSFQI